MLRSLLLTLLVLIAVGGAFAKRSKLSVNTAELDTMEMMPGSVTVVSPCAVCHKGYNLEQVRFSGFDKVTESSKESFFVTNLTDGEVTQVALYIEYLTPDGRQLHKRFLRIDCNIPPGETRRMDVPSWDKQHTFYYEGSRAPVRRKASPFKVVFEISSYNVRPLKNNSFDE